MSSWFNNINTPSDDDLFADTRMSFGDHIEDLRWHLLRAIMGTVVILCGVFVLDGIGYFTGLPIGAGKPLMDFIARPVERELMYFYQQRVTNLKKQVNNGDPELKKASEPQDILLKVKRTDLRDAMGLPHVENAPEGEMVDLPVQILPLEVAEKTQPINQRLIRPPLLATLSITEAFMVYIKVSLVLGIVISSPWIFYQIWAFVAAGLYPTEKRWVYVYGPFSLCLFLAGVVLCETIVIPAAVHYLLGFNEWMGLEPDLRLSEWLSFALLTPVVFGVAFQTPLVMLFLYKIGIVDVDTYIKNWKLAVLGLAIVACLLAASPDAFSMLALAIPLWSLYGLGILLCRLSPRSLMDFDVSESEEMVEV